MRNPDRDNALPAGYRTGREGKHSETRRHYRTHGTPRKFCELGCTCQAQGICWICRKWGQLIRRVGIRGRWIHRWA